MQPNGFVCFANRNMEDVSGKEILIGASIPREIMDQLPNGCFDDLRKATEETTGLSGYSLCSCDTCSPGKDLKIRVTAHPAARPAVQRLSRTFARHIERHLGLKVIISRLRREQNVEQMLLA